jgi:predicted PurR-regulated permease PerM
MNHKFIEQAFFFSLLAGVVYLAWQLVLPFMPALVLAAIIATTCYPLYHKILDLVGGRTNFASLLTTLLVFVLVLVPLGGVGYLVSREAVTFYNAVSTGRSISIAPTLTFAQDLLARFIPNANIDLTVYAKEGAGWVASSLGSIFTSTASLIFMLLIAFIGLYYLFKDGERLVRVLLRISPLPDSADARILDRLARSVRSVLVGSLAVGLLQGFLTALGFTLFGVPQAILWGMVAAIAALIPAIGTSLVFVPTIAFLVISESYTTAMYVAVWGVVIVGLVDNFFGPYLVSRGTALHPFLVLIGALGGLAVFGPIGFILGPVIMSFLTALLEVYESYIATPHGRAMPEESTSARLTHGEQRKQVRRLTTPKADRNRTRTIEHTIEGQSRTENHA